jgi:hypothetical protein
MYYLFEYRLSEGKSKNTYGPYKCLSKVDKYKVCNDDLIDKLITRGIEHKYQHPDAGWKTLYLNMEHQNVIHSGSFNKLCDLIKKYERNASIDSLLSENI